MIIGLTGSFGAGKGAVADYLVKTKGFTHYSARSFLTEEVQRRGLTLDRDTLARVANELRAAHGPSYIVETLFDKAKEACENAVVESLRAVAEVEYFQKHGGTVLGIDADPQLRYDRIRARGTETDNVSFEEWQEQQKRESNTEDPTKQNIFGALERSDFIILNNGTFEELHTEIEKALAELS